MSDYITIGKILNEAGVGFDINEKSDRKEIVLRSDQHGGVTSTNEVRDLYIIFSDKGDLQRIIID